MTNMQIILGVPKFKFDGATKMQGMPTWKIVKVGIFQSSYVSKKPPKIVHLDEWVPMKKGSIIGCKYYI